MSMDLLIGQRMDPWPELRDKEAHLWLISLDYVVAHRNELSTYLCPQELERARRFHFKQHADDYVAGRGALRTLLGHYLGRAPQNLQFCYSDRGKPYLPACDNPESLQFNLSHSGRWALCGVTRNGRIGVDIEWKRPEIDMLGVAQSVFSEREYAILKEKTGNGRVDWFYRVWTGKEAFLKALGTGITELLRDIEICLGREGGALLNWSVPNLGRPGDWHLREFGLPAGYHCATAMESNSRITLLQIPH